MPEYTYRCISCGEETDYVYHMNEERPPEQKCPKCGATQKRAFGITATKVPFQWTENQIDYNKSPSGRKHFYSGVPQKSSFSRS